MAPRRLPKRTVTAALKASGSICMSASISWLGRVITAEARCAPVSGCGFMGSRASVWP